MRVIILSVLPRSTFSAGSLRGGVVPFLFFVFFPSSQARLNFLSPIADRTALESLVCKLFDPILERRSSIPIIITAGVP